MRELVCEDDTVIRNGKHEGSKMAVAAEDGLSGHFAPPSILSRTGGNR